MCDIVCFSSCSLFVVAAVIYMQINSKKIMKMTHLTLKILGVMQRSAWLWW